MIGVQSWRFELQSDRTTVGKSAENDIALPTIRPPAIARDRRALPRGWCVTDLGSSNGTWVNGERIWSSRRSRHGDDIGRQSRLIFRDPLAATAPRPRPRTRHRR